MQLSMGAAILSYDAMPMVHEFSMKRDVAKCEAFIEGVWVFSPPVGCFERGLPPSNHEKKSG
jgi:hypothetical protein